MIRRSFKAQSRLFMSNASPLFSSSTGCIKPNDEKAPLKFVPRNCYEQLTYSGVFEAVAIRKKGFPFRLKHQDFVDRYEKCLKDSQKSGSDLKAKAKNIAKHMKLDMENFKVGRTLVLYRAREYRKCPAALVFIPRDDCGCFTVYFSTLAVSHAFSLFSLGQVPWN